MVIKTPNPGNTLIVLPSNSIFSTLPVWTSKFKLCFNLGFVGVGARIRSNYLSGYGFGGSGDHDGVPSWRPRGRSPGLDAIGPHTNQYLGINIGVEGRGAEIARRWY